MHRHHHRKQVVHADVDLRTLRDPNQRARILQRSARFAECIYSESPAVLALRMPQPLAKLERDAKDTIMDFARWRAIIVGNDGRWMIDSGKETRSYNQNSEQARRP